jgi:hypothetical protein
LTRAYRSVLDRWSKKSADDVTGNDDRSKGGVAHADS